MSAVAVPQPEQEEEEEEEEEDAEEDELLQGSGSKASAADLLEELALPQPAVRHQRRLDYQSVKALRTAANTAARNKKLLYIQVGQHGITQTFLSACMDILMKHEYVRVRLGEGCGLERKAAAEAMEQLLDCLCVHQIGYTVTLYRQQGLARPSNCPANDTAAAPAAARAEQQQPEQEQQEAEGGAATGGADRKRGPTAGGAKKKKHVLSEGKEQLRQARAAEQRAKAAAAPPEFQVL